MKSCLKVGLLGVKGLLALQQRHQHLFLITIVVVRFISFTKPGLFYYLCVQFLALKYVLRNACMKLSESCFCWQTL